MEETHSPVILTDEDTTTLNNIELCKISYNMELVLDVLRNTGNRNHFCCKARVKGVIGHQHHCSCLLGVMLRAAHASRSHWLATQAKKWRADWTVWKPVYNHVVTFTRCHAKGIKELCKEVCCVGTICVECRCNVTKYGRKTNNRAVVVT